MGTPAYMAPEQATGVEADRRTDVYGVGGLIYFILTRKAPHRGKVIMEVLQQAAYEPVTPPRELVPDHPIPKALEDIVLKALAYEPEARHGSIAELASELRRFMRGGGDFPRMRVQKGQHVVRLGEAGDAAYIIVSGRLEVYREVEGARQRFRVMTRGEVFGEMAILGSGIRTANVVALEDAELLVVTRETLQREVGDMKPWVGAIVRTLARRFEQRERELVEASRPSTRRQPSLPEARRVLQLVLMLCEGWCERKREGDAIQLRWSTLANEVDALMQIERAQLASILSAREEFTIDVEADLISLRGAAALRNRLRHAL